MRRAPQRAFAAVRASLLFDAELVRVELAGLVKVNRQIGVAELSARPSWRAARSITRVLGGSALNRADVIGAISSMYATKS